MSKVFQTKFDPSRTHILIERYYDMRRMAYLKAKSTGINLTVIAHELNGMESFKRESELPEIVLRDIHQYSNNTNFYMSSHFGSSRYEGSSLAKEIKKHCPGSKVYLVTSLSLESYLSEMLNGTFDGLYGKDLLYDIPHDHSKLSESEKAELLSIIHDNYKVLDSTYNQSLSSFYLGTKNDEDIYKAEIVCCSSNSQYIYDSFLSKCGFASNAYNREESLKKIEKLDTLLFNSPKRIFRLFDQFSNQTKFCFSIESELDEARIYSIVQLIKKRLGASVYLFGSMGKPTPSLKYFSPKMVDGVFPGFQLAPFIETRSTPQLNCPEAESKVNSDSEKIGWKLGHWNIPLPYFLRRRDKSTITTT